MRVDMLIRRVEVAGITLWYCHDCNRLGRGDSVKLTLEKFDEQYFKRQLHNTHPQKMPVGWTSHGDHVTCPECSEKRREQHAMFRRRT